MQKKLIYGLVESASTMEIVNIVADRIVELMDDYKVVGYKIYKTYFEITVEYENAEYYIGINKELRAENKELKLKIEILEKMIKDLS